MYVVFVTVEKDLRACEALCPKHGVQCSLKMFEQDVFPMHAHAVEDRKCVWKKIERFRTSG